VSDADLRAELELAYPAPAGAPDWGEVLRRLPRRRRRRIAAATLGITAVAAAVLAALGAPWQAGPSFTARALAAIGADRYLVAVVEPERSPDSIVDLATGNARPLPERFVLVVDSGSASAAPSLSGWNTIGGVVTAVASGGEPGADPGISSFAGGYRAALADGSAKVVGTTTYRGRRARILRFTFDTASVVRPSSPVVSQSYDPGDSSEDVAVDVSTYRPLWVQRSETVVGAGRARRVREQRYRVVSIASAPSPPATPPAPVYAGGAAQPVSERMTPAAASRALGGQAVWPGGSGLRSIRLERLTAETAGGPAPAGPGLRLAYADGVRVAESARPQPAYGFRLRGLLPPPGRVRLTCLACEGPYLPAGFAPWRGELRSGRMWVEVEAPTRALVLAAARALRPLR
jgi:hypothetical protein